MLFKGKTDEVLALKSLDEKNNTLLAQSPQSTLVILWVRSDQSVLKIDGAEYQLSRNQIVFLTEFHRVETDRLDDARMVRFNRPFYCIKDHDDEVSCRGLLFYGAEGVPVITIPEEEMEKFEILWKMFSIEMDTNDNLQLEMLRMMLKRLIIFCARLFKEQRNILSLPPTNLDVIREFNYLVEGHFRTKHSVACYAELMRKSPKTLANLFAQYNDRTPLQIIQDRIMLEARRLLCYTDKPVKEITFELGYEDIQAFSRFFKGKEGIGPKEYRENKNSVVIDTRVSS